MNTEYALLILKEEKRKLEDKLFELSSLEDEGQKINVRQRTKYKHQLASIEFSIEVLETYLD